MKKLASAMCDDTPEKYFLSQKAELKAQIIVDRDVLFIKYKYLSSSVARVSPLFTNI